MADAAPLTRRQIEEKIIARAWKDDNFREKFLADPKEQFEERVGTKLPEGLVMTALAEDETHLHFVIPVKPNVDLDELSDADLEKVAGGVDIVTTMVVAGAAVGAILIGAIAGAANQTAKEENW